jgi:archaemetzincin
VANPHWSLELVPVGAVPPALLRQVALRLEPVLGRPVAISGRPADIGPALDLIRRQYLASQVLEILATPTPSRGIKRIGVTHVDLFLPVFTHLYGYAQLGGGVGVVSTFRLHPEIGAAPELLWERTAKEILHELGHTLGLVHCIAPWCAMHPSRWPEEIDLKDLACCPPCAQALRAGG